MHSNPEPRYQIEAEGVLVRSTQVTEALSSETQLSLHNPAGTIIIMQLIILMISTYLCISEYMYFSCRPAMHY